MAVDIFNFNVLKEGEKMHLLFWLQNFLAGKKTILTSVILIVLNGLVALDVITVDNLNEINAALVGFIAWFLRLSNNK